MRRVGKDATRAGGGRQRAESRRADVSGRVGVDESIGGVERVRQQGIVPGIFVVAQHYVEVVPLVLGDPHAAHLVWVSAVAEAADIETVEEVAVVVERAHL